MNDIWSKYVQGAKTLYYSRKLRFDDMFAEQYKTLFGLDENKNLKILEIGCGPGALAGALHRWYPNAGIVAVDRDSEFIRFAREHEEGIMFSEGDITALSLEDRSFDVVISNTVCEHIEPSRFYGEQYRILKPGGICLVLSSRKGITILSDCVTPSEKEQLFWKRVQQYDDTFDRYGIHKYPMNEAELPRAMEQHGFRNIQTGFMTVDLTPDNPKFSADLAHNMIDAGRYSDIEAIDSVLYSIPEHFTGEEIREMKDLANAKYDARIAEYDRGERQWDTSVSIIMVVRGVRQVSLETVYHNGSTPIIYSS